MTLATLPFSMKQTQRNSNDKNVLCVWSLVCGKDYYLIVIDYISTVLILILQY
jgi:hypothetical protein